MNDRQAQYHLGLAYLLGEGVTADIEKAIFWFEKSAKFEYSDAMYSLGILYYYGNNEGYNIPENKQYAIEMFEKAVKKGNQDAQRELEKIKNNTHYLEGANDSENNNKIFNTLHHMDNADSDD